MKPPPAARAAASGGSAAASGGSAAASGGSAAASGGSAAASGGSAAASGAAGSVATASSAASSGTQASPSSDASPATGPTSPAKPPQPLGLEHLSFDLTVDNTIAGPLDISKIPALLHQLTTKIDTKLFIGKLTMPGVIPHPLGDMQLSGRLLQEQLTNISLDELTLRLPDYGMTAALTATAGLTPDLQPQRLHAKLDTQAVHSGSENLPGGLKTSGRVGIKLAVDSVDMRTVDVDGDATFDQFHITVPGKDPGQPPTLVVDKISGQIPFRQRVLLPPPTPAAKVTAATSAPAVADAAKLAPGSAPTAVANQAASPANVVVTAQGDGDQDAAAASREVVQASVQKYLAKTTMKPMPGSNLVATVDYGTIRPFYPERRPLSIQRLETANLEFSKMEFDLELRQNWFALNQFVIGFLGGKIEGDFQLAFDAAAKNPADIPQTLRTSIHMTRLDTRKLLEKFPGLSGKASSSELFSNPYIDATIHLIYDMRSSDISGALDISSIGKEQLRMILYFADPLRAESDHRRHPQSPGLWRSAPGAGAATQWRGGDGRRSAHSRGADSAAKAQPFSDQPVAAER